MGCIFMGNISKAFEFERLTKRLKKQKLGHLQRQEGRTDLKLPAFEGAWHVHDRRVGKSDPIRSQFGFSGYT